MKIKVRKRFKYTWDNVTVHELMPGEYEVPRNVDKEAAELALAFGAAVIMPKTVKKKAPENKARKAKETK